MKVRKLHALVFFGFIAMMLLPLLPGTFSRLLNTIILIVGGFFLFQAIIALPAQMKQARKSSLVSVGKLIKARVVKVIPGKSPQHPGALGRMYRFNPKLYHYIKCEYILPKTKKTYYFYSWSLFIGPDPTPFLQAKINVWVDPNNWKNYYVDLGILPDDIIRGHAIKLNKINAK